MLSVKIPIDPIASPFSRPLIPPPRDRQQADLCSERCFYQCKGVKYGDVEKMGPVVDIYWAPLFPSFQQAHTKTNKLQFLNKLPSQTI